MLKALYDYAQRRHLALAPGYVLKTVKAYVSLSSKSDYLGLTMGDSAPVPCPDIGSMAQSKEKSNVLVEKRSVVLPSEPTAKSKFFLEALRSAGQAEPAVMRCVQALEDPETCGRLQRLLEEQKIKPGDRISFCVDGVPVSSLESIQSWWQEYRRQFQRTGKEKTSLCLITGAPAAPLATVPPVQGLRPVGGHASGDSLICFDKAAFCSYGLKQGENAPVSEEAFAAVKAALDELLQNAPVLAGMKFVHWYDAEVLPQEDPLLSDDFFGGMLEEDGEGEENGQLSFDSLEQTERDARSRADRLVKSVNSGERDVLLGDAGYHILLLTGAGGRVMVRRYERGHYRQLKANLDQWSRDLSLTNAFGSGPIAGCKLKARLYRLLSYQKADKKPWERLNKELAGVTPAILTAILTGSALPDAAAVRALQFIRSRLLDDAEGEQKNQPLYDISLACQWLKAWLIRSGKRGGELMSEYNEQYPSPAYQCGAMMAVYEAIQKAASPDVNVTVSQRYYASAIQTPALVLGRLSQLAVHHLEKMENKWLANRYREWLETISSKIERPIPAALRLEEQSEFALGYYQMGAQLRREKAERTAAKKQREAGQIGPAV